MNGRFYAAEPTARGVELLRMEWTLYYDGGCNLCHASQLRAERWARRAGQPLKADILLGDAAIAKGYDTDMMALEADGNTYFGADAWLRILSIAPWYLRWMSVMRLSAPSRWLARVGYGVVAKLRFRLFGRRTCAVQAAPKRSTQAP